MAKSAAEWSASPKLPATHYVDSRIYTEQEIFDEEMEARGQAQQDAARRGHRAVRDDIVFAPGAAAASLRIGDRVYLRHAKAGELCERFDRLHLVSGGEIVDEVALAAALRAGRLRAAGLRMLQLLPINEMPGGETSPYSALSASITLTRAARSAAEPTGARTACGSRLLATAAWSPTRSRGAPPPSRRPRRRPRRCGGFPSSSGWWRCWG
mgnify:CR=1 FL=1